MSRKKTTGNYFGEEEEVAVLKYNNTDSKEIKDEIYRTILEVPFKKMTSSILRTYKSQIYIGGYEMSEVEGEALTHLLENMKTYNPNKPLKSGKAPKAFSYLQTIVRNYYRLVSKRNWDAVKRDLCYDEYSEDVYCDKKNIFEMDLDLDGDKKETIYVDLFENIIDGIQWWIDNNDLKRNDIIVGEGLISIFNNWEILFLEESPEANLDVSISGKYLKNKIYLLLKEYTNLQVKDIRASLKVFKEVYDFERKCLDDELHG